MNMQFVIEPKSDQINADELQNGQKLVVTIADVMIRGGQEQPVAMRLVGMDKVYRPCKSMCRVLVAAWGLDAKEYVGRSLELYTDPTVKFGPLAVGGLRISRMSHIDGPMQMALTATKGIKKAYQVKPLDMSQHNATVEQDEPAFTLAQADAKLRAATDLEELAAIWRNKVMAPFRDDLGGALAEMKISLAPVSEHEGAGESHAIDADYLIEHINKKMRTIDVNALVESHMDSITGFTDEDRDRVAEAQFKRVEAIKADA